MSFFLLNLLQSQPRLSKFVIVGAGLVLIAGVALLVYFYRRYKRSEGEPEEDWELSRSLFANVSPSRKSAAEVSPMPETATPAPQAASSESRGMREFASEMEMPSSPQPVDAVPPQESASQEPRDRPSEQRPTEVLASPSPKAPPKEPIAEPAATPTTFEDEVWVGLQAGEQPPTTTSEQPISSKEDAQRVARVEDRSHLEPFESPRIERIVNREPFEPPRIEPLTPREKEAVTRELRSPQPPETQKSQPSRRDTVLFGSAAGSLWSSARASEQASHPQQATRELAAEPVAARSAVSASPAPKSRLTPAGSVLGLPAEASNKPLILGKPARPDSEAGIGAFTNYGKDVNPSSSRAGTIALLLVIVLLGAGLALYFLVPSMHSRVNAFVAHVRGTDVLEAQEAAMKPRAQVLPSYKPEVNKNMVKASGAVDNISDAPLENLSIEVSLMRGGGAPPETRLVSVTPNPLPPGERGTFEFEYDGKRDTGFAAYKITRLLSNGTEIRFRTPGK